MLAPLNTLVIANGPVTSPPFDSAALTSADLTSAPLNRATTTFGAEANVVSDQLAIGFYGGYALIAVVLVVWLARTLQRNGEVFLENVFEDDGMAKAINQLLVVGFYLLNLGYALLLYKVSEAVALTEAFNGLVERIGSLLLSLGVIHLLNMAVFWRIRNHTGRNANRTMPPPPAFVNTPPAPPAQPTPAG